VSVRILIGDCVERMRELPDNSVDSVVCDPPYHLTSIVKRFGSANAAPAQVGKTGAYARASKGFMGQTWDGGDVAFQPETWAEVWRVLKPGGHLLAFSGTRTYHRMAVAIEDAGFEVRDMIAWHYGSGFPKSHDISKAIDKRPGVLSHADFAADLRAAMAAKGYTNTFDVAEAVIGRRTGAVANWQKYQFPQAKWWPALRDLLDMGDKWDAIIAEAERAKTGERDGNLLAVAPGQNSDRSATVLDITAPATDAAREWEGWGTALKPAMENICHAQKPWDLQGFCGILARTILEAICQLPSLAKDAEQSSPLSQSVSAEGFGSAQWDAVAECNTLGALFALMDTLPSGSALPSSLSIALSWLNTLAAISTHASTFTTETASSLTTDLRTLKSLLSRNTPESIALAAIRLSGSSAVASPAASLFSALDARLRFTLELSALGPATLQEATNCQDEVASEYATLARKPLSEKSIAANVLKWGTGALNISACRVSTSDDADDDSSASTSPSRRVDIDAESRGRRPGGFGNVGAAKGDSRPNGFTPPEGRWPANLCHDGSDEVVAGFPDQESGGGDKRGGCEYFMGGDKRTEPTNHERERGSAARFFYCAKATAEDRKEYNNHPTVKPIALMRWLVRLVTPKGGTVLDPFMGSGSTLIAADAEQFNAIGCELSPEYAAIAERRIRDAAGMFADVKIPDPAPLPLFGTA
jgi:DNA modification methylase